MNKRRLAQILRDVDPKTFEEVYLNPGLTTLQVSRLLHIESTYLTRVCKVLGVPTRKQLGIKSDTVKYKVHHYGLSGCNHHCSKWTYCNEEIPVILPCELYCYLDEQPGMYEEDSLILFVSPVMEVE